MVAKVIERGSGRYIGRVGGLAVALGIGAAIASIPAIAQADSTTADSSAPRATTSSGSPGSSAAPARTRTGGHTARPAAAGRSSSRPVEQGISRTRLIRVSAPPITSAIAHSAGANPIADAIRVFIGNGTAGNPNAGLLLGDGFSYDATSCTGGTACNGGNGGFVGSGGSGYNGGNGGSAGWFGAGGDGGDGLAGQAGGNGGRGGVLFGSGGNGGNGGAATAVAGVGGNGGTGGGVGALSVLGTGGNGGNGGTGGTSLYNGGGGGAGGDGGTGSVIIGSGGNGGNGGDGAVGTGNGSGGTGGTGGAAGTGAVLLVVSMAGLAGANGLNGSGCVGASGQGSGCGPSVSRVFAPYIDMGSMAQREQTWYMNNSVSPATTGVPSLVSTMQKTGISSATLAFVNQQSAGGSYVWGSSAQPANNIALDSAQGVTMKADIGAAIADGLSVIVSFGGITACQNGVEIGQLNGQAATASSNEVLGTGQSSVTLTLDKPIDFATMEAGSITGQFLINDAVTELYKVDAAGNFTFTHQVLYDVPKLTGGLIAPDGATVTFDLSKPLTANYGKVRTDLSYGVQAGFDQMKQAYQSAIQYFYDMGIRHFDLDIEGPALEISQWGINNQRNRVFKSFQDENTFPDMKLSYVLPIGPNTGWHPVTNPGRLIQSAAQIGLNVSTWNMMAFDYGPASYSYMLANTKNMVDVLIGEADTGIDADKNFPIEGAVTYLERYGLATSRAEAFQKLGVTLMIGQDDTVYVPGATPTNFVPGDAATVEAITPAQVGGTDPAAVTVMNWALNNGVGLLSFWSLGRDRPSFNTTSYNPTLQVTYQTGSPAVATVETGRVAGGGSTAVDLPFTPSSRTIMSGSLYDANSNWLGSFNVLSTNALEITYTPASSFKPVGGTVNPTTGLLHVDFNGAVDGTVWSKMDLTPKILAEYQQTDLVYTQILNTFDD